MAAFARCNGTAITGEAAPFIVRLEVYIDGTLVGSVDHAAPPVGGDWYPWSIPIGEVAADADIVVIDYAAGGPGATGSPVPLDGRTNCATPTPTTTVVAASSSSSVAPTIPAAPVESVAITRPPLPILIVTIPDEAATTTIAEPVGCCADHIDTTTTTTTVGTPNTLPATGANSTLLLGGGVVALALGLAALTASRRRPVR
jgi:LPXTG-motif cell wall-anchored protein